MKCIKFLKKDNMMETRYFNIHDKIRILVEGNRKKMLPIYNDLKFFEVRPSEMDFDKVDIYINLNLGNVNKPLKSKTINYPYGKTVLYKGDDNFYVEDQYKVVKWKTIFKFNQDSINVSFTGGIFSDYFLKLYILQPLLRFTAPKHGLTPFHCSMIERNGKAYVLSAFKGSGKTSTLINALYDGKTNYMSDDLAFVDEETAYAYPTPIHLYSYNLQHFPQIKCSLTASKLFEFFVKSMIFKTSMNYASFPTDVTADMIQKSITPSAPIGKIINLLKSEEKDIVDFLVKTNEFEMFRFVDYMKYFDNNMIVDYTENMTRLYKSLEDKMVDFVVGNEYRNDTYEKISKLIK